MAKKAILDPERELPAPHDMLIEAIEKDGKTEKPKTEQHSAVTAPTSSRESGFPLWIFPLLALFFVLLAAGLYVKNEQKQEVKTNLPQVTLTPTPTPITTENWHTYESDDWRIRFQYPNDWGIKIATASGELKLAPPKERFTISAGELNKDNVDNFINRRYRKQDNRTISRKVLSNSPYIITEYTIHNDNPLVGGSTLYKTIILENNDAKFFFEKNGSDPDPIFSKILSTFTFIIDTSKWKTYTNKSYNFSFKYPQTWVYDDLGKQSEKSKGGYHLLLGPENAKRSKDDPKTNGNVSITIYNRENYAFFKITIEEYYSKSGVTKTKTTNVNDLLVKEIHHTSCPTNNDCIDVAFKAGDNIYLIQTWVWDERYEDLQTIYQILNTINISAPTSH
jgi:hypothetical protein